MVQFKRKNVELVYKLLQGRKVGNLKTKLTVIEITMEASGLQVKLQYSAETVSGVIPNNTHLCLLSTL